MNTNHFPSLELCQRLTEIGFPETGMAHWFERKNTPDVNGISFTVHKSMYCNNYVCPSVMEMLDVMSSPTIDFEITPYEDYGFYRIGITVGRLEESFDESFEGTLPNALAEMIVWLHENKHISFPSK